MLRVMPLSEVELLVLSCVTSLGLHHVLSFFPYYLRMIRLSSAEPSTVWDLIVPVIVLEPDKERESERDVNNTPGHTSKYLERVTEYRATGPPGSLRSLRSRPPCRLQLA